MRSLSKKLPVTINERAVPRVDSSILFRTMPDGTMMLFSLDSGAEMYQVDGVAVDYFHAIDAKRTVGEITRLIAGKHRVKPASIRADAHAFLASLLDLGVIRF